MIFDAIVMDTPDDAGVITALRANGTTGFVNSVTRSNEFPKEMNIVTGPVVLEPGTEVAVQSGATWVLVLN